MTASIVLSIIALAAGLFSMGYVIWKLGYKWGQLTSDIKGIRDDVLKIQKDIDRVGKQVESNKLKIEPFWDIIRSQLPKLLSVTRSDDLVPKLTSGKITDEELEHLEKSIKERMFGTRSKTDKCIAILGLYAVGVRKKERELENGNPPV